MNKTIIYAIMVMFLLNIVCAESAAINQSLSEFTNLTRADNIYEIALEINNYVGSIIGIVILIIFGLITFGISMNFSTDVHKAFLVTFLFLSVMSILLKTVNMIPDLAFYFCLSIFLLITGIAVATRR